MKKNTLFVGLFFGLLVFAFNGAAVDSSELARQQQLAEVEASNLETQLRENREALIRTSRGASASYRRLYAHFKEMLKKPELSTDAIIGASKLWPTERGTYASLIPADPMRPGIVAVFTSATAEATEKRIAELRDATVDRLDGNNQEMRANSFLIVKAHVEFNEALATAEKSLSELPRLFALGAEQEAMKKAGSGIFKTAGERVDRAASGGIGSRKFAAGLAAGHQRARDKAQLTASDLEKVIALGLRAKAFRYAYEAQTKAIAAGKPPELVGFELDLLNQQPEGIEYRVITSDGESYRVPGLEATGEQAIQPAQYGKLNVRLLKIYETHGKISAEELTEVAEQVSLPLEKVKAPL